MKKVVIAALAAALLSGVVMVTSPAHAATARNGVCEPGEFCLYYNSNHKGSLVDFKGSVKTYGTGSNCIKYVGPGNGKGRCVKNDAASAWNRKSVVVTVFYKSNYAGAVDSFVPGKKANLSATLKNDNAGHLVGKSGNTRLENGVYKHSGGRITAYFDGYLNTPGRHEGIDFARGSGVAVYSLIAGKVIYKNEGGGGLSTISIYNAKLNRSVIYLHTNPLNGLKVGDSVSRGQKIATEAARGASATHTHVEMRVGRKERAAKSVNDPTLDNPIPTSFWRARGYNVCCQ